MGIIVLFLLSRFGGHLPPPWGPGDHLPMSAGGGARVRYLFATIVAIDNLICYSVGARVAPNLCFPLGFSRKQVSEHFLFV